VIDELMLAHRAFDNQFAGEIAGVAARSVALLDAIEDTVNSLAGHTEVLRLISDQGRRILAQLAEAPPPGVIDSNGSISEDLRRTAAKTLKDYHDAIERRNCARNAPELTPEDGVEDAYTNHIQALADLHNTIEDMRDAMETLDSMHSPVVGSFANVDDLFTALESD
jgi:hypothetical protein